MLNRTGSRMEPWGTPQVIGTLRCVIIKGQKVIPVLQIGFKPASHCARKSHPGSSLSSNMLWLNATFRSNNIKTETFPLSLNGSHPRP